jgi:hypothetical protein
LIFLLLLLPHQAIVLSLQKLAGEIVLEQASLLLVNIVRCGRETKKKKKLKGRERKRI